jgi:pyridoxal phosphate enzyme (YggS family)
MVSTTLADNLSKVQQTIAASAERAGRDPNSVTIVAVTKTFPVPTIREAIAFGLRIFGENRVQEAIPKIDEIGTGVANWHLIGHLQSNKVKFIEGRFVMVESVDSAGIVEALGRRLHKRLDVLIEVNVGEEPQKTGARPNDLHAIAASVQNFSTLHLQGLMTIAPMMADAEQARPFFRKLRKLRDETSQRLGVALPVLSMGMTEDYEVAVEEGATMLRLGRALFGPRPAAKAR